MKKIFLSASMLTLLNCATNEIIDEQTDNTLTIQSSKTFSLIDNSSLVSKALTTVMDLHIPSGAQASNGGCSTSTGNSYGPNPLYYNDYILRGYGKPQRDISWAGIKFQAGNRPKVKTSSNGQTSIDEDPFTNALSIEFPFQANITYEIILETNIQDFIYKEQHDTYDQNDDYHGLEQSQAFPTVAVELADSPEIRGGNPCAGRPVVSRFISDRNYYKTQKAIISIPPSYEEKSFTFNYSTLTPRNALIIYFLPELADPNNLQFIPESSFNMLLKNIKIIEKPFDPSYISTPNPPLNPDRNPPCMRCPK